MDASLDLLDILITEIFAGAARASDKARLRTIKDLDAAAVQLTQVCRFILDCNVPDADLRPVIFRALTSEALAEAVDQVDALIRPPEDVYYRELESSYQKVRRFLPPLLRTIEFGSTPAGEPVMESLRYLRSTEEKGSKVSSANTLAITARMSDQLTPSDRVSLEDCDLPFVRVYEPDVGFVDPIALVGRLQMRPAEHGVKNVIEVGGAVQLT